MKKTVLLFLFVFGNIYSLRADFVSKNFDGDIIMPIEEACIHFNEWFGTGESSFVQYSDETDSYGTQHLAFQQYYKGAKVENCIIILHASKGVVNSINGDVLKIDNQPKKIKERWLTSINEADSISLIHISTDSIDIFYNAYKKESEYGVFYYDVETDELIKSIPRAMSAVASSGQTKYSSKRSFECDFSNNKYYLSNSKKNLKVYHTQMDFNTGLCGTKYNFTSADNTWSGNYITSVTITGVSNSWWGALVDNYPDLYITITDADDNLLYISDYKSDIGQERNYSVTFRISDMIRVPANGGYKIKVWDYDPIGDPDLGSTGVLNSNSLGKHSWGDNSSNVRFNCQITNWHPANDLFWGLNVVYDYYMDVFNRNSFDNNGATIQAFLHSVYSISGIYDEYGKSNLFGSYINGSNYENAYATGDAKDVTTAYLHFGLGNELQDTRVGLNTIGHEFTHLICTYRSLGELEYSGESGALNESTADMMALSIEHFAKPETFNWKYGEDHMLDGSCTRDFQNPQNGYSPQPDTYGVGPYWVLPQSSSDHGGVHSNSGVSNHWFYLLCEGGSGTNGKNNIFTVQAIGIDKAQRILFNALLNYFPPQTTFAQARTLTEQTAVQIYGKDSPEHQSVANAWYAVGVGDKYMAPTDPVTIKAKMPSNWESTISAWAWVDGSEGYWATLKKDGEWYSYTSSVSPLNIIFVNGTTWNGDNNQSVDIKLTEDACVQIGDNTSGKRSYSIIDCSGKQQVTCAQAVQITKGLTHNTPTSETYTVIGYVTDTDGKLSKGQQIFWMADTKNGGKVFESYWGNVPEVVHVGDKVSVTGNLMLYNTTSEIKNGDVVIIEHAPQAIEQINDQIGKCKNEKILRNGQILILLGEKVYTVTGQEVK